MKLYYYAGTKGVTNFGDELNHLIWPRLLPGIFDCDDGTQFVGIGTVLNRLLPLARRTIVFGAGVGYGPPPADRNWDVYSVRGPLSAQALALPASAAVTDPAVLIDDVVAALPPPEQRRRYAFMPHWQTEAADWQPVCDDIGFGFIDPRWDPMRVLDALRSTEVLLTEAMHGAIVADALRIPWVPIRTRPSVNSFKWDDWCQSMELSYAPVSLPTIWPRRTDAGVIRRARRWSRLRVLSLALRYVARRTRPTLSRDDVLDARRHELRARLARFAARERWTTTAVVPTRERLNVGRS
jgi:succinoglycan biosynthesis protein ExoV